jgi:putative DNA primase/helicase
MAHRNGRPHAPSHGVRAQGRNTLNGSIPHEWLQIYWELGFDTVPVEPRSKAVKINGWQDPNRRFRAPERYRGRNIGIRLGAVSGGLVDVDLDTPDACAVAPYLLPPTRMRMRKQGKPIAHYFYRCTGAVPTKEQWERRDARHRKDRKPVLELRSESRDGKPFQTVVPPSVDEDGLEREWINGELLPADVDGDALRRACLLTAIAAAVLPHYREGARHTLALALAGWLRKCQIPEDDALRVIDALAQATGDTERADRLRAVSDTYARPLDGVQGWRGLESLLPPDVCATLSGWLRPPREADTDTPTRADHAERAERAVVEWRGTEPPIGTDAHAAHVLGDALQGRAAWVDEWGWLVWDGCRWVRDPNAVRVLALAREILPAYYAERATRAADARVQQELYRAAAKACSVSHLRHALDLARGRLLTPRERFDADPFLLNTPSGIVDLRTGALCPHAPEHYLTKLTNAPYDPDADAPTWAQFLDDVFLGDAELIDYMQVALGYSITGDTREQKMFMCYGPGANGKSTLFETAQAALGDYADSIPTRLLLHDGRGDHPTGLARLCGLRLALASETAEARGLNENLAKLLTGGDTITARYLYHDFFSYRPTAKIWLFTNHKPVIRDHSYAMWRRIVLIPFRATFSSTAGAPTSSAPRKEPVRDMKQRLLAEREGILAWLVRGAVRWYANGLVEPDSVRAAVDEYRRETDSMLDWLQQHTLDDPNAETPSKELHDAYCEWCNANGITPIGATTFGRRLGEMGYRPTNTRRENKRLRCWRGIRLRTPAELDDPFA